MSLEERIVQIVKEETENGMVEEIIRKKFRGAVDSAMDDVFKSYGGIVKAIKEEVEAVMMPIVTGHDYSKHVMKLDHVLTTALNEVAGPHKRLVENFSSLAGYSRAPERTKVSELFEKYQEMVSKEVDTDELEVYEEEYPPSYENVTVTMEVEELERPSWSDLKEFNVVFECEDDSKLNKLVRIRTAYDDVLWIEAPEVNSLRALRHMDTFDTYVMMLKQGLTKIEIDVNDGEAEVEVEEEPEPTW
jgi:hypothetical protein